MTYLNRESWLEAAMQEIHPLFDAAGIKWPDKVRVSCGWAKRSRANAIGTCWHQEASADGTNEIQIFPTIDDPVKVLGTLTHELIHASDNGESKHRGYFRTSALAIGLEGKMTATHPGDVLTTKFADMANKLGVYPHAILNPTAQVGKQTTRMLKVTCPDDGYTVRTTQKWIEVGLPTCPCGTTMEIW
jgi:hypothetical protein